MDRVKRTWVLAIWGSCALGSVLALAQQPSASDKFAPYTTCKLPDGPNVVDVTPLSSGVDSRIVRIIGGSSTISISDGRRVMFAYPGEDFYANVKVEFLPADDYAESKKAVLGNFDYLLASGDNSRNYKLKPKFHGFDAEGLDRSKREGGVIGIYLLINDVTRTVVTIYFLNQEPPKRFKTMDEYAAIRDRFLAGFASCIRANLEAAH